MRDDRGRSSLSMIATTWDGGHSTFVGIMDERTLQIVGSSVKTPSTCTFEPVGRNVAEDVDTGWGRDDREVDGGDWPMGLRCGTLAPDVTHDVTHPVAVLGPAGAALRDCQPRSPDPKDVSAVINLPEMRPSSLESRLADARAQAAVLDIDAKELDPHLARFTPRYIGRVSPRTIARHLLMLRTPLAPGELRSRVTPSPTGRPVTRELDVVTHDSPGLFSEVSGVVSLIGGQVVEADAHTTSDGIAVDTFEIVAPPDVSTSWWARFEGGLVDAVQGRIALRAAVDAAALEVGASTTREVVIDIVPEAPWTSVRVRTGDRLGLLFTITDAVAELRLDIVSAKVVTHGNMVDDSFVVRTGDRSALDAEQARQLGIGIRWAVGRLGTIAFTPDHE